MLNISEDKDSSDEDTRCTWGEFKKQVEERGITDDWEVSYIDWDDGHVMAVHINEDKSFNVT